MSLTDTVSGLGASVFLSDLDDRDRDPTRLVATVTVGLIVGVIAAMACMVLITVGYTLLTGRGAEGVAVLVKILEQVRNAKIQDLNTTLLRMVLTTLMDGALPVGFVALAAALAHRPFLAYLTSALRFRWRLLGMGLLMSAIFLGPLVLAALLTDTHHPAFPVLTISPGRMGQVAYALASLLLIPAAAAEEVFFRGWMLRQTAAFTRRPLVLLLLPALIFAALHFEFTPDALIIRTVLGLCFAYMTLRLGGVEFAVGAHALYNILIVLLLSPLLPRVPPPATFFTPMVLLENAVILAGFVLITEAVARVDLLRRIAGVRDQEISGGPLLGIFQ